MLGKIDEEDVQSQHRDLQSAIEELREFGAVEVVYKMAILSLIGKGLKRSRGMAGKMFSALGDNNINIEMISQGASEASVLIVLNRYENGLTDLDKYFMRYYRTRCSACTERCSY